jgi:flagellar hook assembly protein FlgD
MKTGDDYPVKSIRYFSVKIYNRWGNKVYEYEDNTGKWQELGNDKPGWDGTTRVGTKAKPGVYYYAIVAEGWDGRDFKVSGYVHIFY